jgi:hypothetical protein
LIQNPEIKHWTDSRLVAEGDLFESLKKVAEEKMSKHMSKFKHTNFDN